MAWRFAKIPWPYWLTAASLAVFLALGYWFWSAGWRRAPSYTTAAVSRGDIVQTVSANGTLNPVTVVQVGSQVSGTVHRLLVDYNSRVQRGQVLLELDPTLLEAQVAQDLAALHSAEATLALNRLSAARAKELHVAGYISQADFDQAAANVAIATAQVEAASAQLRRDRRNLAYAVIRSPVDGIVIDREVDVGQTVAASFQTPTLFRIGQNLQNMQIDMSVDEADVGLIATGQAVRFSVDAYPDRQFAGRVLQVRLNAAIQQNVVTYDVVIGVDNRDGKLLPGMTAYANIVVLTRTGVLRVPNAALRLRLAGEPPAAGNAVYILNGKVLRRVAVKPGASDGQQSEILSGELKPGELVVTGVTGAPATTRRAFQLF